MATLKIEFNTAKVKKDGRHPVNIRCTVGSRIARFYLTSAYEHEWDAKNECIRPRSRKDYAKINVHIEDTMNKIEKRFIRLKNSGDDFDPGEVFMSDAREAHTKYTFNELAELYLKQIKQQNSFTHNGFKSMVTKFTNWINNDRFKLKDLTLPVLNDYIEYLKCRGNGANTIRHSIKILRFIAGFAQNNEYAPMPTAFAKLKLPSRPPSGKTKLSREELAAFAGVVTKAGSKIRAAQQAFLMAIYLRGMRVSDLLQLKAEHIVDGNLVYQMQKAGYDHDILLPPAAMIIYYEYRDAGTPYLFPFLKWEYDPELTALENQEVKATRLHNAAMVFNRYIARVAGLAGITKKVSSHISRHTFGKMLVTPSEGYKPVPFSVSMQLMGHKSIKVHQDYIMEMNKKDILDDAANALFK